MTPEPSSQRASIDTQPANRLGLALAALLAVSFAAAMNLFFGDVDLNLADEGFLWYGVQRTLAGEVPIRDFQSYEPGRYYWCAGLSPIFGSGILGVRRSVAVFQAIGLFCGLCAARRVVRSASWLPLVGLAMTVWMFPGHKLFEPSLALMAVWVAVRLIERPSARRHLVAGIFVGLAGFFGRNHALYAGAGIGAAILFVAWKGEAQAWHRPLQVRIAACLLGGIVGAAPMLGLFLGVPGFWESFLDSILFFTRFGTNLPFPYRFPWSPHAFASFGDTALTLGYLLPCILYPIGALALLCARRIDPGRDALWIAATLVGIPYAYHMAVRSDPQHLAQSIQPALLLAMALPALLPARTSRPARPRAVAVAAAAAIAVAGLAIARRENPALIEFKPTPRPVVLHPVEVAGDELRLPVWTRAFVERLQELEGPVRAGEGLFAAPFYPGVYALLETRSPVWENYVVWTLDEAREERTIRALEDQRVRWALIWPGRLDGRDDLRFARFYPRVSRYLEREFERAAEPAADGSVLLRRRGVLPDRSAR